MDAVKYMDKLLDWNEHDHNFTINDTLYDPSDWEIELPLLDALEFWPYQVILIILYSTTAFVSLAFNLVTIVVLSKGGRISTEIWQYLINLSVSDISMSIFSIPFTYTGFMLNRWIFPTQLCPVVNFAQLCAVFVSTWTLTVIGIDR
ncbi:unnamed protein product [Oppiella nova]|uniref:G-protein coupled receptors family 1 profile domain-containing protein n=1 Tax=Oppiella nova TaxID=334625 RepID=A0A7R9M901_9ACAR|nr:unnamed protein product [Oppiella nova]CAG2172960.1 unnamed protein product [Oppiella nova]